MTQILRTFVFALVGWALLSGPASAIKIEKVTSKSGVSAWLVQDKSIPLIAFRFSFEGAAGYDPKGKAGLSEFLTGMLDEGAGDMPSAAFQRAIKDNSIRLSFSSSQHRFDGSLQTLSANRDIAFRLLKLALTKPRFDPVPLERVRQQFLVSVKQDLEKPGVIATRKWLRTMVGQDHPYARPRSGSVESLKAITADDLRAKAKSIFVRKGLLVSVTGDIDAKTLSALLDDLFGDMPAEADRKPLPEAKIQAGGQVQIIERDIPQSIIRFGHRGIKRDDPDFIPGYVLFNIFGSGQFGSRLMEEIREKRGLAYSAYATLYPLKRAGLVYGSTATVNARVGESVKVIRDEFTRMAKDGPTQKELDDAIAYLTGSYALSFDSNTKIAGRIMGFMKAGLGMDYVEKRNELIKAVTLADVKRVAKRLLKPGELTFTIVGKPKGVVASKAN